MKIGFMATLLPVIWTQLGCKVSADQMMAFTKDDRNKDDYKALSDNNDRSESSEEIRTLIIKLLDKIIRSNHDNFVTFCASDESLHCLQYLNILHLLFTDQCPQIRTIAMNLLLHQIKKYEEMKQDKTAKIPKLFAFIFDDYAEYLCLALATGFIHQRGKIRLKSFECLSKIICHNIMIKKSIPPWLTDDEKLWKYICCLTFDKMKYVKDSLAMNAFEWMSLLEKDNEADIKQAKIWMLLLNEKGLELLQEQNTLTVQQQLLRCVSFIITLCSQKLNHWKAPHRLVGINALHSLIMCVKQQFPSEYIVRLLPAFINLIESENEDIGTETANCLELFGTFIPIKDYSDTLLSKLECSVSVKSNLKIAAEIFRGYKKENVDETELMNIFKCLSNSCFAENNNDEIGVELLKTVNVLLSTLNEQNINVHADSIQAVLWLIVQTHAGYLQNHDRSLTDLSIQKEERLNAQISDIMRLIAGKDEDKNGIWQKYFEAFYEKVNGTKKQKDSYYLFGALAFYSKSFITAYMNLILPVFKRCNDEQNTEIVRFAVLSILHSLLVNISNISEWNKYSQDVLMDILFPNILWKPGKFRFKMRLLALECMLILYKKECVDTEVTWSNRKKLLSTLKSRSDDHEYKIRFVVIQLMDLVFCTLCFKKMNDGLEEEIIADSELNDFCQCILERFDDSKDEIRICTCSTLQSFMKCIKQSDEELYSKVVQTALIHLDDANKELQVKIYNLWYDKCVVLF